MRITPSIYIRFLISDLGCKTYRNFVTNNEYIFKFSEDSQDIQLLRFQYEIKKLIFFRFHKQIEIDEIIRITKFTAYTFGIEQTIVDKLF